MASTVAPPLERQFGQIAGVTQMTSTSVLGSTSITLQFDLDRNIDAAAQDVQAAITAAGRQLPTTLPTPPTYRKVNPADSPILILAAHSDTLPLTEVDDFADTVLAQQISQITGVAQVIIGGEQKPAIRVQVDPAKLQTRGLTLEDVRGVLGDRQHRTPPRAASTARSRASPSTPTTSSRRPRTTTTSSSPTATARRSACATSAMRSTARGRQHRGADGRHSRSVILLVFKQPGANVIDTVDQIKAALPQLYSVIPPGMQARHDRRPHPDHPRLGARRRVHAGADDRARRDGDPPVPAQPAGDDHSRRHGAALAARRRRR